jgi:asparagine synthetase A
VTVQDENLVDIISTNEMQSAGVLTVSDHLDWSDAEHQTILQTKLNRHLAFVESEELLERYPAVSRLNGGGNASGFRKGSQRHRIHS